MAKYVIAGFEVLACDMNWSLIIHTHFRVRDNTLIRIEVSTPVHSSKTWPTHQKGFSRSWGWHATMKTLLLSLTSYFGISPIFRGGCIAQVQ